VITLSTVSIILAAYLVKKSMEKKSEKDAEKGSSNIDEINILHKADQLNQEHLDIQKKNSFLIDFDHQNY